ncbi:hypothetical protein BCR33DRAFT_717584 [Rhizoclosmatium globosum]|uniref:Uncharacterized protein n=1 Tax=Rhizoclosmatium globosum TaxID=329046 RepID=A0A1Y2C8U0_9FUNG|nr:hypothetical protein BCR33DRAFT_717584 [Rhizoclosmatium globosum]|eukprot:ORY43356.1 hypothetical protein BCR33DRAFT_717584 [Rhizoclosmatium globosum]
MRLVCSQTRDLKVTGLPKTPFLTVFSSFRKSRSWLGNGRRSHRRSPATEVTLIVEM